MLTQDIPTTMYYYYKTYWCQETGMWYWKIYYYHQVSKNEKQEVIYTKSIYPYPSEDEARKNCLQWIFETKLVAVEDS